MKTLTNIELVQHTNPVIYFTFNNATYALRLDGSEVVMDCAMIGIDNELTYQLSVFQDYDTETTIFTFDDFEISYCNNEASGKLI